VEMATGRAPWGDADDVLAALHRIGYTDAVPEVPAWMSAEARDFLARCFARDPRDRWAAAQLLEHPFLASAGKAEEVAAEWVSPKSTLDAGLWESESESDDEGDVPESPARRIKELAGACSALPDWESDDGEWIQVLGEQCQACNLEEAAKEMAGEDKCQLLSEASETEVGFIDADAEGGVVDPECSVAVGLLAVLSVGQQVEPRSGSWSDPSVFAVAPSHRIEMSKPFLLANSSVLCSTVRSGRPDDYPIHIGLRNLELPNTLCDATIPETLF